MATLAQPPKRRVSDAEILHPDRAVRLSTGVVVVREARIGEWFQYVAGIALPITAELTPNSNDAEIVATFQTQAAAWHELFHALSDAGDALDATDCMLLMMAVADLNRHLLLPREEPKGRRGRLGDVYAVLARNGHGPLSNIQQMTERQIVLLYESTMRDLRECRAASVIDANLAAIGGDKANKHIKELTSGR